MLNKKCDQIHGTWGCDQFHGTLDQVLRVNTQFAAEAPRSFQGVEAYAPQSNLVDPPPMSVGKQAREERLFHTGGFEMWTYCDSLDYLPLSYLYSYSTVPPKWLNTSSWGALVKKVWEVITLVQKI